MGSNGTRALYKDEPLWLWLVIKKLVIVVEEHSVALVVIPSLRSGVVLSLHARVSILVDSNHAKNTKLLRG